MGVNLKSELEASRSLVELLELAEKTRQLYIDARLPLPDALKRMIGTSGYSGAGQSPQVFQPKIPSMPPDGDMEWAWIVTKDASPVTLVTAILRGANQSMRAKELYLRMTALGIKVSLGTVANAALRLENQGVLKRDAEGNYQIAQLDQAAVLYEGYVWGPPTIFTTQELASHRRDAIIQILRQYPSGLQMAQITERLRQADWLRAPVNRDLVKGDMDWLSGERIVHRKAGNSKKWELLSHE